MCVCVCVSGLCGYFISLFHANKYIEIAEDTIYFSDLL